MKIIRSLLSLILFLICLANGVVAQDAESAPAAVTPAETAKASTDAGASSSRKAFDEVFSAWKGILGDMRMLQAKAGVAENAELQAMVTQYDELVAKGEALIPKLRDAAIAVYKEAPNTDKQITNWLATIAADRVSSDLFSEAAPAVEALVEGNASDPVIFNNAGIISFVNNDFGAAAEHFAKAAAAGVLTQQSQGMMSSIEDYRRYWEREKRLREEADALTGDDRLPRVQMETNRGTLVIELFEDEAPETVGNFVHLVESGFYDGLTFHRVLGSFMAQGGCPEGNGRGGPGYEIYCECEKPDHRKHFMGSLSMAHAGRDTGGSQFFLTFLPTPQLNGEHTVFGRVVEGMDVLAKIRRRDPDKSAELALVPDKILKMEVLNKRDHKYEPNKVK